MLFDFHEVLAFLKYAESASCHKKKARKKKSLVLACGHEHDPDIALTPVTFPFVEFIKLYWHF